MRLKKLYNELNREKETELNKAREQAAEIVELALAESDDILKKSSQQISTKTTWDYRSQGSAQKISSWKSRSF